MQASACILLRVPLVALELVSDYVRENTLSHTCRYLWDSSLRLRHVRFSTYDLHFSPIVAYLDDTFSTPDRNILNKIRGLQIHPNEEMTWQIGLPFTNLQHFFIDFEEQDIDEVGDIAQYIIGPSSWCLESFHFLGPLCEDDCDDSESDSESAQESPHEPFLKLTDKLAEGDALQVVQLTLGSDQLTAGNFEGLARAMEPHKNLRRFALNVKGSYYSSESLGTVFSLLPVKHLQYLSLLMDYIGDPIVTSLGGLFRTSSELRELEIELRIPSTLQLVGSLLRSLPYTSLHVLRLHMRLGPDFYTEGSQVLSSSMFGSSAPTLQLLDLQLTNSCITDDALQHLLMTKVAACPELTSLRLSMTTSDRPDRGYQPVTTFLKQLVSNAPTGTVKLKELHLALPQVTQPTLRALFDSVAGVPFLEKAVLNFDAAVLPSELSHSTPADPPTLQNAEEHFERQLSAGAAATGLELEVVMSSFSGCGSSSSTWDSEVLVGLLTTRPITKLQLTCKHSTPALEAWCRVFHTQRNTLQDLIFNFAPEGEIDTGSLVGAMLQLQQLKQLVVKLNQYSLADGAYLEHLKAGLPCVGRVNFNGRARY
eukprot:TRINITY_DN20975_c0_g1_i1.p1 TRINITY_DN20975_c0_g1~~TRINITY_DN20975_c0_g1_i1.p1  ORF type:complete len:594 (+),score=21.82 TRINITY_DN20975_c0_g1_i1:60-1841(+)